jgi:lipid II isoglutaminyl synthase (glutamine-hydrolysing)
MRTLLAVTIGKLLRSLIRIFRRGGGSAFPGVVASRIDPNLLTKALKSCQVGLVVVSGSAGKSSTTYQLVKLLQSHGLKVFTNPSTANIKQGLFAAVLKESNLRGEIDYDIAVLEWDEGHGAAMATQLPIRLAVLTNVLSDQLDRFTDPELVTEKLRLICLEAQTLVVNADDKNLAQFAIEHQQAIGFGLTNELFESSIAPQYALNFGQHPQIAKQVLVKAGDSGHFSVAASGKSFEVPVDSASLALNYAAALAAANQLVRIDETLVNRQFSSREGVFARNEKTEISGRRVNLRLVQNPTSFQLNLDELSGAEAPLMLMAGRDIHDPSWLWTVDFSGLNRVDVVGGFNAYELALRLSVAGVEMGQVLPEIPDATKAFFDLDGDNPTILFSADAMRRFRRHTKVAK